MDDFDKEIEELYLNKKYNCCRTVMLILSKRLNIELSEDMQKVCSFYGGGIGRSGCVCGALIGALNIAALKFGEMSDNPNNNAYKLAHQIHSEFIKANGSACCKNLRGDFSKPSENCKKIIKNAVVISSNLL